MESAPSAEPKLADINTVSTRQLEALLKQQEADGNVARDNAQAKAHEVERLREQAAQLAEQLARAEDKAKSLKCRREENELVVKELRNIIAERDDQTIDKRTETSPSREPLKRPCVSTFLHLGAFLADCSQSPDPSLNAAQKRIALAPADDAIDVSAERSCWRITPLRSQSG